MLNELGGDTATVTMERREKTQFPPIISVTKKHSVANVKHLMERKMFSAASHSEK